MVQSDYWVVNDRTNAIYIYHDKKRYAYFPMPGELCYSATDEEFEDILNSIRMQESSF